jgi:AraC-like DNA-binding protein
MRLPTESVQWFNGMLPSLRARGLDVAALVQQSGIDARLLEEPEARIAQIQVARFWTLACAHADDPLLALRASRDFRPGSMHLVGYLMISAATLGQAFTGLLKYQQLLSEVADCRYQQSLDGGCLQVALVEQSYVMPPALTDLMLGNAVAFARWLLGANLKPRLVCLQRAQPRDLGLYEEIFGCPLRFNCAQNSISFHLDDLNRPLLSANADIYQLHWQLLEERLRRLRQSSIALQVSETLKRLLEDGEPSRERVAGLLHLSSSTLHRRLQAEGTTFKLLLDQTRALLAKQYLVQSERPLLDIAFQLGFSDPSNFFRSFKRWYGVPPGQFRSHAG